MIFEADDLVIFQEFVNVHSKNEGMMFSCYMVTKTSQNHRVINGNYVELFNLRKMDFEIDFYYQNLENYIDYQNKFRLRQFGLVNPVRVFRNGKLLYPPVDKLKIPANLEE